MPNPQDDKEELIFDKLRAKEAEDLAKILAPKYGLSYIDLSKMAIDLDALKILSESDSREGKMAVFQAAGRNLQVAVQSPNLEKTKEVLKNLESKGFKITLYLVSSAGLERVWKRYKELGSYLDVPKGLVDISGERLNLFMSQAKSIEDLKKMFSQLVVSGKTARITEVLEVILAGGISIDASDVHIEPQEESVRLRFRLDGVLHDILFFDYKTYNLLLSRIKLVSGLKLNIHEQAQDGRFSIRINDTEIEIRTSVIPENYGESIVLRILNPKSISVKFEDLGLSPELMAVLEKEIKKPNGMILTTGPTGSGKTTTLYAFLKKVYSPEVKIITIEDPIEYHLQGIIQTQVEEDQGYTFLDGLRSILRQDPDIIMVGEIRDVETAKIAINSALTGHLVLSTLHTNNAAGTIPRLIDLGVNPNVIAPALNVSMAQRLVRKLCNNCKEKYEATEDEKNILKKFIPPEKLPEKVFLWRAKGCDQCNNFGYKGRIGVFEAILIDEKLEKLILQKPGETEIMEAAKTQGIPNMQEDGIRKVLEGITSLDELGRVIEL